MCNMKSINALVLLILSFMSTSYGSPREYHCGKQLADLLDLICSGRGFYWVKDQAPILNKRNAVQYLKGSSSRIRRRRGIVNECCENPCTAEQMESYCAVPAGQYVVQPTAAPLSPEDAFRLMRNDSRNSHSRVGLPAELENFVPTTSTTTTTTTTTPGPPNPKTILENLKKFRKPFGISQMSRLLGGNNNFNKIIWVRKVGPRPTRTPVILEQ